MNTYLVITSLLNFSVALVMALTAFVTARRNVGSLSFGFVALSVGVWSGGYFLWRLTDNADTALQLCRLLMIGACFIPATLLHFGLVLTGGATPVRITACYVLAVSFAATVLTPLFIASIGPSAGLALWPRAGPVFGIFLVYFFGFIGATVRLLMSKQAGLSVTVGNRRLVVAALTIGVFGGSTNFPLWYGVGVPPLGNGLVFVYHALLGYVVTKSRLPHLRPEFVKSAGFFGISTIVGVLAVLVTLTHTLLSGTPASGSYLTSRFFYGMLATAVALWAVPVVTELTEKFLGQNVLKNRHRILRQLKPLLRAAAAQEDEPELLEATARRLADIFAANDVAIYFQDELEAAMRLRAALPARRCPPKLGKEHPLVSVLNDDPVTVSAGRLTLDAGESATAQSAALRELGFDVAVPMAVEGRVDGIILLSRPAAQRDDNESVTSLLEAVAAQVALAITARRLERRANQSEKLIALGTLSAGLAHELRNPLTSIQTFLALTERGVNPAQDPGFLRIVQRDAARITSIIENVSVFAANAQVVMSAVQLDQLLTTTVEIAREESAAAHIRTLLDCRVHTPVRGNYGQLQQVFVNLVQNAFQAIGTGAGEIQLVAESIVLPTGEPGARVLVRDTGPGVPPEVLPRIFEPFVTTKATGDRTGKRGMGLGLAIVKRIIEAHDGDIRVESTPGQGTQFFVYLPTCRN